MGFSKIVFLYMSGIDAQEIETLYIEKQKQVDNDDL